MKVRIKLYAMLAKHLPDGAVRNEVDITVADEANVSAVLEDLRMPIEMCHLVLVNGTYVAPSERPSHVLIEGDHLAVWPPVAGG